MLRYILSISALILIAAPVMQAEDPGSVSPDKTGEAEIDFEKEIKPIFVKHCNDCHGPDAREGGLRFTGRKDLLLRNDSGKTAVVDGHSDQSELIHRITTKDEDEKMPPVDEGEPLSAHQILLLKKWIDSGAHWPETKDQKKHWSYIKPIRPELPKVNRQDWVQNPIDSFVLARMENLDKPLAPSKQADPAKLLRRVYLDLIGLPPSPEEVDRFLKAPSKDHYEKIVNKLLASPRYGEKWARPWLDLARYADSNGFQADQIRSVWPYRDWVIKALNDDMPFDQFTIEQIAGDLLPKSQLSQKIATGFHRCTTCNIEAGVDPEENRTNQIIDRVNTTGLVWLGTTMECAQCHNHKYDPFTQQDYYQIFAFFNNTPLEVAQQNMSVSYDFSGPKLLMPIPDKQQIKLANLNKQNEKIQSQLKKRQKELTSSRAGWEELLLASIANPDTNDIPENIRKIILLKSTERSNDQKTKLSQFHENRDEPCSSMKKKLSRIKKEIDDLQPDSTLVMVEMPKSRESYIFKRGEFLNKGAMVNQAIPNHLHSLPEGSSDNRLGFANWLVSRENPLVARVTINRWWYDFFGRGIVTTQEDFGSQGDPPSHPKLLDWLAVELMDHGWSIKNIHKLIVTSATYQQSSHVTNEQLSDDPYNIYLARGSRLRLSAETIRDNALAISGLLSTKMYGPPVYPPQPENIWRHIGRGAPKYITSTNEDRYRRGIYVVWRRSAPYPSFINFDATDRASCTIKRSRTNTPLQALTLLNDPAYVEITFGLAKRLAEKKIKGNKSERERIEYGFRLAVSRVPTEKEISLLLNIFQEEKNRFSKDLESAKKLIPKEQRLSNVPVPELAAWFYISNILLNLDETITKG